MDTGIGIQDIQIIQGYVEYHVAAATFDDHVGLSNTVIKEVGDLLGGALYPFVLFFYVKIECN